MPKVTVIPATKNMHYNLLNNQKTKRKVAGYARVSTDSEEQKTSYNAQLNYYTKYIKSNSEWEFVDVYTDEGISATNTKKRDGFNRMISDALAGKIDLIITKSVSRFARNTVDSLVTVRKLKEKGIEVYFEKENIYTLDSKGELLITIMSSLAQEESRSISENVTWGQRKRFADGKINLPYRHFLGYDKGDDGMPVINEKEAVTVRRIYKLFLQGLSPSKIASILTSEQIPTPSGKEKWCSTTIQSILKNEKYKGSALLQKSFTVDFLNKTKKQNEGEVPQYYIEDSHPAIIGKSEFEMVQAEIMRRSEISNFYSSSSIFSSKIICEECKAFYGSKVWHSNDKYRKVIWRCNHKYNGKSKCKTPCIDENVIEQKFVVAFNKLIENKDEIIDKCQKAVGVICDCKLLENEVKNKEQELKMITLAVEKIVETNGSIASNQEEFLKSYNEYSVKYEELQNEIKEITKSITDKKMRKAKMLSFIKELEDKDKIIDKFSKEIWCDTISKVVVKQNGKLLYEFKNDCTIEV